MFEFNVSGKTVRHLPEYSHTKTSSLHLLVKNILIQHQYFIFIQVIILALVIIAIVFL